jgi:hypothetical protein
MRGRIRRRGGPGPGSAGHSRCRRRTCRPRTQGTVRVASAGHPSRLKDALVLARPGGGHPGVQPDEPHVTDPTPPVLTDCGWPAAGRSGRQPASRGNPGRSSCQDRGSLEGTGQAMGADRSHLDRRGGQDRSNPSTSGRRQAGQAQFVGCLLSTTTPGCARLALLRGVSQDRLTLMRNGGIGRAGNNRWCILRRRSSGAGIVPPDVSRSRPTPCVTQMTAVNNGGIS